MLIVCCFFKKSSIGADPKSVLCAFFKAGQCGKGDKCKFSHDLALGRKGEKRSIYDSEKDKESMFHLNDNFLNMLGKCCSTSL